MRNQERDDFSRISVVERNTGEKMVGMDVWSPNQQCFKIGVPNSLFVVAPIQQLMVTYPFC